MMNLSEVHLSEGLAASKTQSMHAKQAIQAVDCAKMKSAFKRYQFEMMSTAQ